VGGGGGTPLRITRGRRSGAILAGIYTSQDRPAESTNQGLPVTSPTPKRSEGVCHPPGWHVPRRGGVRPPLPTPTPLPPYPLPVSPIDAEATLLPLVSSQPGAAGRSAGAVRLGRSHVLARIFTCPRGVAVAGLRLTSCRPRPPRYGTSRAWDSQPQARRLSGDRTHLLRPPRRTDGPAPVRLVGSNRDEGPRPVTMADPDPHAAARRRLGEAGIRRSSPGFLRRLGDYGCQEQREDHHGNKPIAGVKMCQNYHVRRMTTFWIRRGTC
jgi:hypothetical protein